MEFISQELDDYVVAHSDQEPALLAQLSRETGQKILQPRMLSGHYQGRVLSMISKLIAPKMVLEIGTFTGYSALCLLEGLAKDGQLHTLEKNEELEDFARKYFDLSGRGDAIKQHIGDAREILPSLGQGFDLVFIDADKTNYTTYLELILPKMNPGGIILSDNVLWSGKVIQPLQENDADTKALLAYNTMLKEHKQLETVLLPIRDGLTISRLK
ncbi:MAG: O-methyltransferase [Gilvibacter sp.]